MRGKLEILKEGENFVICPGELYGSSTKNGISGFRIPISKELVEKFEWPLRIRTPGILKMDDHSIIFYRSDKKQAEFKRELKYPRKVPSLNKIVEEEITERIVNWLLSSFVSGYSRIIIECDTHLVAEDLSRILKGKLGKILEKMAIVDTSIKIQFPAPSTDFSNQLNRCLEDVKRIFILTSDLLKNCTHQEEEYIERGIRIIKEKEEEIDYVTWSLWRNVHISFRSGSYITELAWFDPYELISYSGCSKLLERAGDYCASIACLIGQIYNIYKLEVQNLQKLSKLDEILSELSEMFFEFPDIYEEATQYFLKSPNSPTNHENSSKSDKAEVFQSISAPKIFRINYVRKYCSRLQDIYGGTDLENLVESISGLDPTIQIKIAKLMGELSEKIRRLVTYPYNIMRLKDTGVMYTEDLIEEIPAAYKTPQGGT